MNPNLLVGAGVALLGFVLAFRSRDAAAAIRPRPTADDLAPSITTALRLPEDRWQVPPRAEPFLQAIRATEEKYRTPRNFIAASLYQESRFREDIIKGDTVSPAGAIGIAQLIPRWHPNVDPYDPFEAIDYMGQEMRKWKNALGSWEEAIVAYNWGPGNWQSIDKDFARLPKETSDYIRDVMGRVG